MPDRLPYIGPILTGLAAFIGAVITGLIALIKHKKTLSQTKYYKSGVSAANIINLINQLVLAVPHAKEASVIKVRNGDGAIDANQKPKYGSALYSTNWATKEEWKAEFEMEDNLVAVVGAALFDGHCIFFPRQLQDGNTLNWYEANGLLQSTMLRIAVNTSSSTGIFLVLNYDKEHIVAPKTRIYINTIVSKLQREFEPEGYMAKKNYITS